MHINRIKSYLNLLLFAVLLLPASCIDEKIHHETKEGYIEISGINSRSYTGSYAGDEADNKVETLRILAFNKTSRACENNVLYYGSALAENTLRHPIEQGEYDFIFLANEPAENSIKTILDNISEYDDLKSIAYPATHFTSERSIPMIAENNGVKILPEGKIEVNNNTNSELKIGLRRLAARFDVVLKSTIDWGTTNTGEFKGITLSNLPDRVPLVYGLPSTPQSNSYTYDEPTLPYTGTNITRDVVRQFTLADNAGYFEVDPSLLTVENQAKGLVWAAKVM